MTPGDAPPDAEIDKVNGDLSDGLKSCRSMVNDYRAMLSAASTQLQSTSSEASDGTESLIESWRTQEDSNL